MRHPAVVALLAAIIAAPLPALAQQPPIPPAPVARVAPVTDNYFGTKITDPYRWMESEPEPEFRNYLYAERTTTPVRCSRAFTAARHSPMTLPPSPD